MLRRYYHKLRRKVVNPLLWSLIFTFDRLAPARGRRPRQVYTVCVTTFLLRYDTFFKPLVRKLAYLFRDLEVLVLANGHYDRQAQQRYLEELKAYLEPFASVRLISFLEPQGLSRLWNLAVEESKSDKVFIFNDDIDVSPFLRREIESAAVLDSHLLTNGGSWSQFFISRDFFRQIGPFDEGLKEIGGEDDDYLVRMKLAGVEDQRMEFRSVWSLKKDNIKVNSYGKVMKEQHNGYSNYNAHYLQSKWEMSPEPLENGVFVRGYYWRPKQQFTIHP